LSHYRWEAEHVSGAKQQKFPLIAELHLRESRSPLRFPLRSRYAHMLCWEAASETGILRISTGFAPGNWACSDDLMPDTLGLGIWYIRTLPAAHRCTNKHTARLSSFHACLHAPLYARSRDRLPDPSRIFAAALCDPPLYRVAPQKSKSTPYRITKTNYSEAY